jgi:CHAT domain
LAARVKDLRRALLNEQPHIVHFSGHGTTSGLILEDDNGLTQLVSESALASLFENYRRQVECVVLNACYSEVQAQAIYGQIDCVIGMNQPIGDTSAINFATGFYDAVFSGESYHYAFNCGLSSMQLEGSKEHSTPVILFRPTAKSNTLEKDNMSPEKSQPQYGGISQSMSGGTMHGGMQAAQGNNNNQTMTNYGNGNPREQVTQQEVVKMLAELEQDIDSSDLVEDIKEEVTAYLGLAKKATEKENPNKERVKSNLEGVVEVLQSASKTSATSKTVWEKTKPVLLKVTDWIG